MSFHFTFAEKESFLGITKKLERELMLPSFSQNEDEHLLEVKYMEENGLLNKKAIAQACGMAHLKVVKYLRSKGVRWGNFCIIFAAGSGHLNVVQYLRTKGVQWHWRDMGAAIHGGNKELIKWMVLNGRRWSWMHLERKFDDGNLEFVKWAIEEGCPQGDGGDRLTIPAASHGDLDFMKYLYNHGGSFYEEHMSAAARRGHLDLVKWLREIGCGWKEEAIQDAMEAGQDEMVRWLRANGAPE